MLFSEQTKKIQEIICRLDKAYPKAAIALQYRNPMELLVATILSAQCTDKRVNMVTEDLFKRYHSAADFAGADASELEACIRSTGFFRNKTRHILGAARMILEDFDGQVPGTMEQLLRLPGVARKTANIVLYNAFGRQDGIAVDTHVKRLSQRLGLSRYENADKIEEDLMRQVASDQWGHLTYLLIEHGRAVCIARKPRCGVCVLRDLCPWGKKYFK